MLLACRHDVRHRNTIHTPTQYCYEIDELDRIVDVDDAWLDFARSNGAGRLTRESVIGESLGRYIIGWRANDLYMQLIALLRSTGMAVKLPFRCDSPELKRYMELEILPRQNGHMQLIGRLLHTVPRRYVPLLDLVQPRNGNWLLICALCRKIKQADDTWAEVEDALPDPHAVPATGLPQLSHDVCPACTGMMRRIATA